MGTDGKAVAVRPTTQLPGKYGFTSDRVELIRRTVAPDANNDELEMFLYRCQKTGLDPIARQIHFVKRGGKGVIQTGIDGYRLVAERTNNYAGSDDPIYEETPGQDPYADKDAHPWKATVTVWKMVQGQRCGFTATARWGEYAQVGSQGFMWARMPYLMLAKVAEALALRKAFPQDLSGMYVNEEMHQADEEAPREAQPVVESSAQSESDAHHEDIERSHKPAAEEPQPDETDWAVVFTDYRRDLAAAPNLGAIRDLWERVTVDRNNLGHAGYVELQVVKNTRKGELEGRVPASTKV
jgi:phage recombination protein Bet